MTKAKTSDVRVHLVSAATGKTTKKKAYQKPGSALSFAAKASRVTGVREAMIFTGNGKVATLIARDGKFWTPVEKDRPAVEIALPKLHLMRAQSGETEQLPIASSSMAPKAAKAKMPFIPARPEHYQRAYRTFLAKKRKSAPRYEAYGLTKEKAREIRDVVSGGTVQLRARAVAARRSSASTAIIDPSPLSTPREIPEPGFTVEDTQILHHAIRALVIERAGQVEAAKKALDEALDLANRTGVEV